MIVSIIKCPYSNCLDTSLSFVSSFMESIPMFLFCLTKDKYLFCNKTLGLFNNFDSPKQTYTLYFLYYIKYHVQFQIQNSWSNNMISGRFGYDICTHTYMYIEVFICRHNDDRPPPSMILQLFFNLLGVFSLLYDTSVPFISHVVTLSLEHTVYAMIYIWLNI